MSISGFFLGSLLLASTTIIAIDESETSNKHLEQFCYLEDKAYSLGARILQQGKVLQCLRNNEGTLSWQEPEK